MMDQELNFVVLMGHELAVLKNSKCEHICTYQEENASKRREKGGTSVLA